MSDFFPALVVGFLGLVLALLQASRYSSTEARVILLAFAAHFFSAFVHVKLTQIAYGWGDLFGYARKGTVYAAGLRYESWSLAVEMLKIVFHQKAVLPFEMTSIGSSTAAMAALAGFVSYLTNGGVYAQSVFLSCAAHFGTVSLYGAIRRELPREVPSRWLLISVLVVPSVVFWTSSVIKETVAMAGLGFLVAGFQRTFRGRMALGLPGLVLGAIAVGVVKAYVLFAFTLAAGGWLLFAQTRSRGVAVKSGMIVMAALVSAGGIVVLGELFPQYALENFAEQAAHHQEVGQLVRGGSTYEIGDPTQRTLLGQLAFAPLALVSSLFRPFIFEARNALMVANGLETAVFLALFVAVLVTCPIRQIGKVILDQPFLVFCVIFCVSMGVAVGLTTTNLGTLSRYRAPLVPFLMSALVALRHLARSPRGSGAGGQLRDRTVVTP